jgi:hypothetical protein
MRQPCGYSKAVSPDRRGKKRKPGRPACQETIVVEAIDRYIKRRESANRTLVRRRCDQTRARGNNPAAVPGRSAGLADRMNPKPGVRADAPPMKIFATT